MPTYRCTRAALYLHLSEPARSDTSRRQGHYIEADSPEGALAVMAERFPNDAKGYAEPFTVQEWVDGESKAGRIRNYCARTPVKMPPKDLQCPNCKLDHCEHMQQLAAQALHFIGLADVDPEAFAQTMRDAMFDQGLVLRSAGRLVRADRKPRW